MQEIQQKALDHYDRMIAWAKTQPPTGLAIVTGKQIGRAHV